MQRKPRQDPVSCQLCRSKKLKCNRETPCSNCAARGVTCRPANGAFTLVQRSPAGHGTGDQEDIIQRLQRLEDAVFGKTEDILGVRTNPKSQQSMPTPKSPLEQPDQEQRTLDEDTRELESIGTRDNTLLLSLSNQLAFEICSIPNLLQRASSAGTPTIAALPDRTKALELLDHYRINVDHTARILHIPTMYDMVNNIYASLAAAQPVASGQVALMLAVFTMSAYFSLPVNTYPFAADDQEALLLARIWGKGALDALDHSRRTTSGTLEDAQASILMSFILYHFDGLSARGRQLTTNAIAIGRDLRLHLIDEWGLPDSDFSPEQRLEREIKRRVWWHIASTDWILSSFSGPQEGAYFVHANHMHVRLPNECSDEELSAGKTTTSAPPPAQQYFLQRIRIAQLCREIIDVLPIGSRVAQADYERVKAIDQKLLAFLDDLPPVLRISDSTHYSLKLDQETNATITGLRYYINTCTHGRRCKLHQQFLIRQSMDPRFAYSRQACLDSARTVFRLQQELDHRVPLPDPTQPQRLGTKTHFMQLATVVMVMDLCFNKEEPDKAERIQETRAALRVFEEAAAGSKLPLLVLKSLIRMLQKHHVQLPDMQVTEELIRADHETLSGGHEPASWDWRSAGRTAPMSYFCPRAPFMPLTTDSTSEDPPAGTTMYDPAIDPFWQMAMQSTSDDTLQWDHLFSDFDTRVI